MSEVTNQNGGELLGDAAEKKLGKLPHKSVTIHPSTALRMRIVALAQKLDISAREVLEHLLATAADLKIPWVVIQPQNGAEAGIAFTQVEKVMVKVFNLLNQATGSLYRLNANQQAKQVEVMREGCVELWTAVQKLAKETFFSPDEYKRMCECHTFARFSLEQLKKQVEEEQKKEKPDATKISMWTKRIVGHETTVHVLTRLGCGEPHDAF